VHEPELDLAEPLPAELGIEVGRPQPLGPDPVLQRRGIYRTEYEGATLRDHLGLPIPQRP